MKFFVTTPIYYVNAKPHIGHLYTAIAADVLARWKRSQGYDVLYSTGTDENSQKNVEAAQAAGKPVQVYVDDMARQWEATFKHLGLTFDVFIRTTAPEHVRAVETMLARIDTAGDIYLGDYEGLYCVGCEAFVAENELIDGKCPIHHTVPKQIKEKNYFFRLSKYRAALLQQYKDNPYFVQPQSALNSMLHYIEHEMDDISISRQSQEWGIRLPQNKNHAVYVWFDALINYLTVTGYPEGQIKHRVFEMPLNGTKEATKENFSPGIQKRQRIEFEKFWPPDLHLIGKDIIKFHCAIWPAMLLSAGLPLPKKIFANGFFTVDGQKISKSLNNAIDPLELIKEYPFDAIRYYLLRDIPFGNDGDFSHERLKDRYNADLANGLGNLVSRVLTMIDPTSPTRLRGAGKFLTEKSKPLAEVAKMLSQVGIQLESLAFDKALTAIGDVISWADELIERTKPWQLAKEGNTIRLQEVLGQAYEALLGINKALAPFMPETHQKLTALLTARPLKKPVEPLFARK